MLILLKGKNMNKKVFHLVSSVVISGFIVSHAAVSAEGISVNLGDALSVNINDGISVRVGEKVPVNVENQKDAVTDNVNISVGDIGVSVIDNESSVGISNSNKKDSLRSSAIYSNMELKKNDFSYQNLAHADFSNATLYKVNFSGANLVGANFESTDLKKVNFSGANLTGANFVNATFKKCNLLGAIVDGTNFTNVDFGKSKISGVDFSRSTMENINMNDVNLSGTTSLSSSNIEIILTNKDYKMPKVNLDIRFSHDSDHVKAHSMRQLDELAKALQSRALIGKKIIIEGHTDSDGSNEYNLDLSQRRANNIVNILVNKYGIVSSRLVAKGYGESTPIYSNKSRFGKSANRRVTVALP